MNTYTITFRSDAEFAVHDMEAETPQHALDQARKYYNNGRCELRFEPYDGVFVNEIAVCDAEGNEVAVWLDNDMRLRVAGRDLLAAAEAVVARWEQGDLAEAVRSLSAAIAKAKEGPL